MRICDSVWPRNNLPFGKCQIKNFHPMNLQTYIRVIGGAALFLTHAKTAAAGTTDEAEGTAATQITYNRMPVYVPWGRQPSLEQMVMLMTMIPLNIAETKVRNTEQEQQLDKDYLARLKRQQKLPGPRTPLMAKLMRKIEERDVTLQGYREEVRSAQQTFSSVVGSGQESVWLMIDQKAGIEDLPSNPKERRAEIRKRLESYKAQKRACEQQLEHLPSLKSYVRPFDSFSRMTFVDEMARHEVLMERERVKAVIQNITKLTEAEDIDDSDSGTDVGRTVAPRGLLTRFWDWIFRRNQ